jgi:hypothetical protein
MQNIRQTEDSRIHWDHYFRKTYELGEPVTRELVQGFDYRAKEFYAITLTPLESKIHELGIWYNIDERERQVIRLWKKVKHHLNRNLHNNYMRHPNKQIKDFIAIEHYDRKGEKLIKPHLHGTIAIDKSLKQTFEEVFDEIGEDFKLNFASFDNNFNIKSVFVRHIPSYHDLNYWNGYVLKQYKLGDK